MNPQKLHHNHRKPFWLLKMHGVASVWNYHCPHVRQRLSHLLGDGAVLLIERADDQQRGHAQLR